MVQELVLYSRHGCHLCEEMDRALRALSESIPLQWVVEDVDRKTDWRARYGLDVPVLVAPDGEVLCKHVLDEDALLAWHHRQG